MIKIAIMMKQMLSKGNCKDLGIAITQGMCYRGILASKRRLEYRTIGECISNADALSALPQCQKTLLIDDDCVSSYLESTESDFFTSNLASLNSNSYITPQKHFKEVSLFVHELIGISKSLEASSYDLKSKEWKQSNTPLFRWKSYLKSFLDHGTPNVILIKGSPGNEVPLTIR